MNVTHIIPYYQEGLGYEENYLGHAQQRQGADVTLVTSTRPLITWTGEGGRSNLPISGDVVPLEPGRYQDRGVTIARLPPLIELRGHMQVALLNLAATVRESSPDIVQLHSPVGALTVQALRVARSLALPVVVDSHVNYFNLVPYGIAKRAYYSAFGRLILPYYRRTIKRFLAHGPNASRLLRSELRVSPQSITQITLGTETDVFVFDKSSRESLRRQLGYSRESRVLMVVGRITRAKEVEVLVRAHRRLRARDVHLLLVGPVEEEYKQSLTRMLPHEHKGKLMFRGHVPHNVLPEYFSAADIAIWPGDPAITIIEAMSCSLPLVVGESDSSKYYVSNGNGHAFPRGDEAQLAVVLDEMLKTPATLQQMGCRSRDLACRMFDWDRVAKRSVEVYREVLAGQESKLEPIWDEIET